MSVTIDRLGTLGAKYSDPFAELDFEAADAALPWLPPELLSVTALPLPPDLTEKQRRRLSQVEFGRLCAAGIWLEGLLVSRVTARGLVNARTDEARVMLQEVREEAGHGLMFLEMIERAGLGGTRLLGGTGLLTWIARRLDARDAEFWAMVYIGESVTNNFVARALRPTTAAERICPLARQVMALHHREEGRHIAAARALLERRLAGMGALRRHAFAASFRVLLKRFLAAALFPTGESLELVGIADAHGVARAVRAAPARRALALACAAPALRFIARAGLPIGAARNKGTSTLV